MSRTASMRALAPTSRSASRSRARRFRGARSVAEHCRDSDISVNPTRTKKLTNMRTTSSDENIILKPARKMTLEQALEYIEEDELVEATPQSIRLRKELLTENERKRAGRKAAKPETVEA